jgi:peptidyl-tRNA hydrolase
MSTEEIRREASATYNEAFDLIESGVDVLRAVDLASKSLELWRHVGNDQNMAIGYWLQSRAFAAAGNGHLAIQAAETSMQHLSNIESPADWLIASVNEGLARAYVAANDSRADEAIKKTAQLVANIADDEDREIIAGQFASISTRKTN